MNALEQYLFDVADREVFADEREEKDRIMREIALCYRQNEQIKKALAAFRWLSEDDLWWDYDFDKANKEYLIKCKATQEADEYFGDDVPEESYEDRRVREHREQQERLIYNYPKNKVKRAIRLEMAKTVKARNRRTLANADTDNLYDRQVKNGDKRGCKKSEITQKDMWVKYHTSSKIARGNLDLQGKGSSYRKTR